MYGDLSLTQVSKSSSSTTSTFVVTSSDDADVLDSTVYLRHPNPRSSDKLAADVSVTDARYGWVMAVVQGLWGRKQGMKGLKERLEIGTDSFTRFKMNFYYLTVT